MSKDILEGLLAKRTAERDAVFKELTDTNRRHDLLTAKGEVLTEMIADLETALKAEEEQETTTRMNLGEAILADLATMPSGRTLSGICAALSRKPSQIKPALERLTQAEKVVFLSGEYNLDGRYVIAEHAAATA